MCPKLISSFGVTIKGETMKGIFSNPAENKIKDSYRCLKELE